MTLRPLDMAGWGPTSDELKGGAESPDDYPPLASRRTADVWSAVLICSVASACILAAGIAFCGVC